MSVGKGFADSFLGMDQFSGAFRKQQQDLSPGGRKQNLGTGFGLGKSGFKMSMYKDDNDSDDNFTSSLLNKPGFVQKSNDRDLTQHMSHLNLYGNNSDSRTGTWNGSAQAFDDQRAGTWNGGQSFDAIVSQTSQSNPFISSSLHNSDASADLWNRGSTSQSGGLAPYSSIPLSQSSRQSSTTQFSRSFSQPQSASIDRFNPLSGSSAPPISTGFQHISSGSSGQTSPGRNGLLSLGGRSAPVQLPSSGSYSQSQSILNNSVSKAIRPGGLPSSLSSGSRSSPNLLPLGSSQQQQQQQSQQQTQSQNSVQQPPHRVGSFGSLTSSGVFSGFGTSRSLSSSSQVGLLSHVQASSGQSASSVSSSLTSGLLGGSSDSLSHVIGSGISNFDLEFPVLANRVTPSSSSPSNTQSSSLPPRTGYGGALQNHDLESFVMVTGKNQESGSEFQIQNEDFPALPGSTQSELSMQDSKSNVDILFSMKEKSRLYPDLLLGSGSSYESVVKDGRVVGDKKSRALGSAGIQTSSSGVITNIPVGMVTDQFGMIGLLTFIRAAETDPDLVTLALGSDLTTLGLNLNSTESLHHTFGSPFSDTTCRPHEIDYHVPPEYLVNTFIRDRLAPARLSRYCEDLLFYLYYTNCGDIMQLAAATELFSRDWRYHKEERVWITRAPGMEPQVKTSTYERGTYHCFDQHSWRKVAKEFHVEYDKLEEKPSLGLPSHQQSVA